MRRIANPVHADSSPARVCQSKFGLVSQLEERRISNPDAVGSSPTEVALLRLVGHVMHKVGEKSLSPRRAEAVRSWWKCMNDTRLPQDSIFHDFIEEERNNIVKEYDFRFP